MRGKTFARLLAVCLAVGLSGTAIYAVDSPETLRKIEQKRRFARRGVLERWEHYRQNYLDYRKIPLLGASSGSSVDPLSRSAVDDIRSGASLLSAMDVDTIDSPGLVIGITSQDAQANYALGHQVAASAGGWLVHFVWTMWDHIPESVNDNDRFVNYNSYDGYSHAFNQGFNGTSISLGEFARGGFPRIDTDSLDLAHVVLQQRIEEGCPYSSWHLYFPIWSSALHADTELPRPPHSPDEPDMMWPEIAIAVGGVFNVVELTHVISMGARYMGNGMTEPSNRIWYHRYNTNSDTPAWEGPVLIDSTSGPSYSMAASDVSNRVCIAYTSDYTSDECNGVNNVVRRISSSSGDGWISGDELGDFHKRFVTLYEDPSGPRAWMETSCAYDHAGNLHIIFLEQRWPNSEQVAIRHWEYLHGTIRPVAFGYYENDGFWQRTLNLGHISLGVGDGSTMCMGGAESNEDYLYVMYTKLCGEESIERRDMSQLGFCNGQLYMTSSNSGGFTWEWPHKLTLTTSEDCTSRHPDSLCASEAWGTMAHDVSNIEIMYIRDFEAGSYEEAPWTVNRVMYLSLGDEWLCPEIAPSSYAFISSEPECEYHADPGGVNVEQLTIVNVGNADMVGDVAVTAGDAWLSVSQPGPYTIPPGGADIVMDVMMDASGLSEDLYVGYVEITHNDLTKYSPHYIPIEFFVVTDFKCPQDQILRTAVASPGVLSLEVLSNSRFGNTAGEGGLWRFVDSSSTIFDASLLLAHGTQDPDTIVYHRFFDGNDPGQYGWRALTDLKIDTSAYGTGDGFAKASADMTTADSVTKVRVEWFLPQNPVYGDFVIAKYTVWNRAASPVSDVAVALWADIDVVEAAHMDDFQQGVENHGNYVQAQNLIYQYGYDTIGNLPATHLQSAQRYSGGVSYLAGRDASGAAFKLVQAPIKGAVGDNRDNTGPGRPDSRFFYRTIVGGPGVSVWEPTAHADSAKDCYTWMQLDHGRTLDADGANPEVYVVAWLSDTLQHDAYSMTPKLAGGLQEVCDSAWAWADRNAFCQCPCHTDPQCDGVTNVLDVVHAVNVAFRGALPVFDDGCPYERTDVDCTGFTNVLDVVRMVNVAFRGALPATQFCDGCQ
ncbi:MAG TPA: hypothetical protein VM118_04845 [Acidobacteriota bacterium]|nr:hypothetical protein [Acidobacteriota bacterium]